MEVLNICKEIQKSPTVLWTFVRKNTILVISKISEIIVNDERLTQLDKIVTEVKQSEEWEAVRMSILSIGLERGEQIGLEKGVSQGKAQSVLELLEENGPVSEKTCKMILSETDTERLSTWLKKAAKSNSEEDFLSKIQ